MDAKRLLTGTVVGGIVMSVMGFLIYEVVFGAFMEAQMTPTPLDTPIIWAGILSAVAHGLLLTFVIGWTGDFSPVAALKTGALFGFLLWLGTDMIMYSLLGTGYATLTGVLVDPLLAVVQYGVAGASIGAVAGKKAPQEVPAAA